MSKESKIMWRYDFLFSITPAIQLVSTSGWLHLMRTDVRKILIWKIFDDVIIFWDYCSDPKYQFFWLWCNGFIEAVTDQLWLIYTSLNLFYKYWSKISHYDVIMSDFTKMLISRILSSFSVSFRMLAILNCSFCMNQRLCTYLSVYLMFINHIKTKNMEETDIIVRKIVKITIKRGIFLYFINISSVFLLKNAGEAAW